MLLDGDVNYSAKYTPLIAKIIQGAITSSLKRIYCGLRRKGRHYEPGRETELVRFYANPSPETASPSSF
jgi:hypothetical protein